MAEAPTGPRVVARGRRARRANAARGGRALPPPTAGMDRWQRAVWGLCGLGLAAALAGSFALVWRHIDRLLASARAGGAQDLLFEFTINHLATVVMVRYLALLTGAAMVFAGLALSFHTLHQGIGLSGLGRGGGVQARAALATHSPGVVAVVLGAAVIALAVTKTVSHQYSRPAALACGAQNCHDAAQAAAPPAEAPAEVSAIGAPPAELLQLQGQGARQCLRQRTASCAGGADNADSAVKAKCEVEAQAHCARAYGVPAAGLTAAPGGSVP